MVVWVCVGGGCVCGCECVCVCVVGGVCVCVPGSRKNGASLTRPYDITPTTRIRIYIFGKKSLQLKFIP